MATCWKWVRKHTYRNPSLLPSKIPQDFLSIPRHNYLWGVETTVEPPQTRSCLCKGTISLCPAPGSQLSRHVFTLFLSVAPPYFFVMGIAYGPLPPKHIVNWISVSYQYHIISYLSFFLEFSCSPTFSPILFKKSYSIIGPVMAHIARL